MTTARQIIRKSMQRAGILTKTEQPSADEANDALDSLNAMLSSWSTESLLIFSRSWENFTLSGGVGEYTIGAGQDFDTVRPTYIVEAHIRDNTTDIPMEMITDEMYNSYISDKDSPGIPYWLNFDNGWPDAKIRMWPVPQEAYILYLLTEKPLAEFALDDNVNLPSGWEDALIDNLAVKISPEYGQEPNPMLLDNANKSKANIRRAVMKTRTMDAQPLSTSPYNVFTGFRNR